MKAKWIGCMKTDTPFCVGDQAGQCEVTTPKLTWPMTVQAPTDERKTRIKELKRVRGAVCFGALAAHFGAESSKKLEWRVDRRLPYGEDVDSSPSNKYLRWRQGTLPHDDSLTHVEARTAGSVRLGYWRDLPLWQIMSPDLPPISGLHQVIEQMPRNIRKILLHDTDPAREGRFHHTIPGRSQILAVRNQRSLDAFMTLVCLARKGEVLENDPLHFLPAACAYEIFPRILYSHKPLRYRWEGLFECLRKVLWCRVYSNGASFHFPIEMIHRSLAALDADPEATLPNLTGLRVSTSS